MKLLSYDLDLFMGLNDEYASKRAAQELVSATNVMRRGELESAGRKVAEVNKDLDFKKGMRVLEIGCGRGYLGEVLRRDYGCEVVGLDIRRYPEWDDLLTEGLDLRLHDISLGRNEDLGVFDRIVSLSVWEHMEHPYAALTAVKHLLNPNGGSLAYIAANLYRGTKASHRYREVFFPWPHLLFDDDVFVQFHRAIGSNSFRPAAWVNKLTVAHYEKYVQQLDFDVVKQWTRGTPIDEEFYERFIDKLGRYPLYDLERDFIYLVLGRQSRGSIESSLKLQIANLESRLRKRDERAKELSDLLVESRVEASKLRQSLRVTRESSTFRVGSALVAAARNPSHAWRLPSQLWQIFKSRGTNRDQ